MYNISQDNNSDSLDSPLTDIEIRRAINKLKSDRSGGPDGLCIEMFKSVVDDTSEFLAIYIIPDFFQKTGAKALFLLYTKVGLLIKQKIIELLP